MKTDALHKIARSRGIDMATIAKKMNCSTMQAYRYMNFPKKLKVYQVIKIAEVLKRAPSSIFALIAKS